MKIRSVMVIVTSLSSPAFAEDNAQQQLLNAITVCGRKHNPLTEMRSLGGNSFVGVIFEPGSTTAVTANIVKNFQLLNSTLNSPAYILGKIRIELVYPAPDYNLVCHISRVDEESAARED